MNNEKLLQMLGEIDEKHLSEANRDVEMWLEERNGIKVTVERPKRSPWKLVTALSCSAAALIGAFVLISNVPKIANIGNIANSGNTDSAVNSGGESAQSATLSEQLAGYEIKNLDRSKMRFFSANTPNSGQWQRLSFEKTPFGEQSADILIKAAADYGVTIDKNDIMVQKRRIDRDVIPLSEANFVEYNDLLIDAFPVNYPYSGIFYNSEDFYIETIPSGGGWIELYNKKNIRDALEIELDNIYFGAWRPGMSSKHYTEVDPTDESQTCVLNGKTVKVADAVRNAEKLIEESDMFPKVFDKTVRSAVSRFEYANGCNALWLDITYTLDGVEYMSEFSRVLDKSKAYDQAYSIHFYCGMLTENSIDWVWQYQINGEMEYTSENCDINVNREEALKLVSMELDQNDTFIAREMKLVYADRLTDGGNTICIEPTWLIWFSNNESWKTERIYAYVSAVDGKVQLFYTEP